jgi:phosphoadenosine phosphosulfate reductase
MSVSAARVDAVAATLAGIARAHPSAVFASSFGAEDMVLLDLIAAHAPSIGVFTLDTGRLPEETHALIARARAHYGIAVSIYLPDAARLEAFVNSHGPNSFFDGIEQRRACCALRKSEPLRRALAGKGAWVTGLRRDQSSTRADLAAEEFDSVHGLPKFNPLAQWSEDDVWSYLRAHRVPWSALHDRGYRSIGCAPCTRAVEPGEDVRAGRWWWEQADQKECGLHRRPASLARATAATPEVTNA